jgi:ABC-type Fe3+-citrate transport system substrate-binding protein
LGDADLFQFATPHSGVVADHVQHSQVGWQLPQQPLVSLKVQEFTQDIIDTLGKRFTEILIPVPKDKKLAARLTKETQEIIESRATLRNRAKAIALELQGKVISAPEELEEVEV